MVRTHQPARPFQIGPARATSTGGHSRRSHLRSASPSWSVSPQSPALRDQGQSASGVKMMPHRHPEDRVYTVISGVFYIGLGRSVRRR